MLIPLIFFFWILANNFHASTSGILKPSVFHASIAVLKYPLCVFCPSDLGFAGIAYFLTSFIFLLSL